MCNLIAAIFTFLAIFIVCQVILGMILPVNIPDKVAIIITYVLCFIGAIGIYNSKNVSCDGTSDIDAIQYDGRSMSPYKN